MVPSENRQVVLLYLVLLQTCGLWKGPDVMLCVMLLSLSLQIWSKSAFTAVNCRKCLDWHFLFINSHISPLQFALLCLVELLSIFKLSIFKVTCLRYTAAQWIESTQRSAVEIECLFSWFLTGEEKLVGRQRLVVWASCRRCFWNVFLIYLFAFALTAVALALCWWFK